MRSRPCCSLPLPSRPVLLLACCLPLLLLLGSQAAAAVAVEGGEDSTTLPPLPHVIPLQRGALGRLSPLLLAEREEPGGSSSSGSMLRGSHSKDSSSMKTTVDVVGGTEAVYRPLTTLDPRLTAYFALVAFGGGQVRAPAVTCVG